MSKQATLYRIVSDKHICPFGIKSKYLLKHKGFEVKDCLLESKEETDRFKEKYNVKTTPQAFVKGKCIGGYEDLVKYFNVNSIKQEDLTYQPIIAVFSTAFLMALATNYAMPDGITFTKSMELFIAFSMCVLAILKLRDLYIFSNQFITYDLLAMKWVPYAYIYPFIEMLGGIVMIADILIFIFAPLVFFIGLVGTFSVIKAVYIDKRDLKCACVGGGSNVPLGFISLTENVMMIAIATWMLSKVV